jgi:hypothetical protein
MNNLKHVGKMKNNSARVVVVYRTLPDEPYSALVVGTQGLGDSYHDSLMSLLQSDSGQQANELADILAVRKFPDGNVMLAYLHNNGHLKKVPTNMVLMTPNSQTQLPLEKLNEMIAQERGVSIEDLAVNDGSQQKTKNTKKVETVETVSTIDDTSFSKKTMELSPAEMRSRADALYKEAAKLRKEADDLDPPKTRKKTAKVEVA